MRTTALPASYLKKTALVLGICAGLFAVYVFTRTPDLQLTLEMSSTTSSIAQLYFDTGHGYSESDSISVRVLSHSLSSFQTLVFRLPADNIGSLRFDPLVTSGTVTIKNISVRQSGHLLLTIPPADIVPFHQIVSRTEFPTEVVLSTEPGGNDPGVTFRLHRRLRLRRAFLFGNIRLLLLGFCVLLAVGIIAVVEREPVERVGNGFGTLRARVTASATSNSVRKDVVCCLALILLTVIAYLPLAVYSLSYDPLSELSGLAIGPQVSVAPGSAWLDPNAGFTTQAQGKLSADDWLQGVVPWWNPYSGVGFPLAAEMQASSLFLPFVLLLHFASGVGYLKIALQIFAGVAMYLLLRQLGMTRFAAVLGGVLYQFNGTFAWFAHAPITPVPFLPLFVLGIERSFTLAQKRRPGGSALIAIAIAYSLYAGFPETAFLDGLLALVWAIQRLAVAPVAVRARLAGKILTGGLAGLLLAAPAVIPLWEFINSSGLHHEMGILTLPTPGAAVFLLPYIFGPIGAFGHADSTGQLDALWGGVGGYFGLTLLLLAILALTGKRTDRGLRWTIAIWITPFILRTLNVPGFFQIFHAIPGMDSIAMFRYSETSWEMAGAVLAGYALDDWRRGETSMRRVLSAFGITLACGAAAMWVSGRLIARLLHGEPQYAGWLCGSLAWGLIALVAITALCLRRPTQKARALLGA